MIQPNGEITVCNISNECAEEFAYIAFDWCTILSLWTPMVNVNDKWNEEKRQRNISRSLHSNPAKPLKTNIIENVFALCFVLFAQYKIQL